LYQTQLRRASGQPFLILKSRTNLQGDRHSPDLPILIQGKKYQVEYLIESVPELSFFLQRDFFNRQADQIESIILRQSG
nr:accessory Sec system protein Asp3 [Streptococcus mitis]